MKDFLRSLLSRKFLLALGSILVFISTEQYDYAMYTAFAYLGVEGSADALERLKTGGKSSIQIKSDSTASDEPDYSQVMTGASRIRTFDEKTDE